MSWEGDIALGQTIDIGFVTTSASTGAPTTLSGTPAISAYIGNSTTQLTAGITLSVDFDGVTGYNNVRVVASSGNGYTAATDVRLVITTGTVGGTSAVGYVVGSFSIQNRGIATISGTTQTARDLGASVLLSAGTGTGQLDFTSGVVKANLAQILGTALTETAGQIAAAFKKFFNIATPASTMDHLTLIDTVTTATTTTNLTNAPTAGDFTATMKTSIGTAVAGSAVASVTGNVGGSVGSVVGAVGSVTGNVGGNVVGSVASVTARVTANTDQLAGQTVVAGAGVTFPASVASPTNITAGTITNATNVTNGVTLAAAAIDAASLATTGKNAIADATLDRDMSTGTDSGTEIIRTPRQALRVLRNKVDIPNGKVKKEDDTTDSWTFAVTTAAGNPVSVVDPT